jgi:4-hydroxy-tetrahydrodipicolinate reductase
MKILLIGYGRMGKAVEKAALNMGHQIAGIVEATSEIHRYANKADVAIEFTLPTAVADNIKACAEAKLPIVSGTTGWDRETVLPALLSAHPLLKVLSAFNLSIGVALFMEMAEKFAAQMSQWPNYAPSISETHHTAKLDAPSGTAIELLHRVKSSAAFTDFSAQDIQAFREGDVIGEHTLAFKSEVDSIALTHSAQSREGFAMGAVLAAEFLVKQAPGSYTMHDVIVAQSN